MSSAIAGETSLISEEVRKAAIFIHLFISTGPVEIQKEHSLFRSFLRSTFLSYSRIVKICPLVNGQAKSYVPGSLKPRTCLYPSWSLNWLSK
jgi:hypothetical protein